MIACMGQGLLHISCLLSPLRSSHRILIKSVNPRLLGIGHSLRVMLYMYHRPIVTKTPSFGHHYHCSYGLGLFCLPLQILVHTLSSEMRVLAGTKGTYGCGKTACRPSLRPSNVLHITTQQQQQQNNSFTTTSAHSEYDRYLSSSCHLLPLSCT